MVQIGLRTFEIGIIIRGFIYMGNFKLLEHENSKHRHSLLWIVLYYHINNWLDDLFNTEIKMLEGKTLIQLFTILFGVPAFIYAWFDDVQTWATKADLIKGILLTTIGAFTALVIGCRQLVKLLSEWDDLRKKTGKGESEPENRKSA